MRRWKSGDELWLYPLSGPGVPRGTTRQAQPIPPRTRKNRSQQGGEAHSKSQQQGKICHPPQDFKTMFKSRVKANEDTSWSKIRRRAMAGKVYPTQ